MSKYESYVDYCKNFIIDELTNRDGEIVNLDELYYNITEEINVTGSCTCNTYVAREYIRTWFHEACEFIESTDIEGIMDPFLQSEGFMVVMVIEGVRNILSRCETTYSADIYDTIELNKEVIDKISKEMQLIDNIKF